MFSVVKVEIIWFGEKISLKAFLEKYYTLFEKEYFSASEEQR